MSRQGPLLMRLISIIALALASGIALSALINSSQVDARATHDALSIPKASFLYRFDTMAQSFFTIPLSNDAVPIGVAVTGTSPTHVWVAEHGLDRITHVVFTNTSDYMQTSYSITSTANSGPYRIAVHGNDVWFTERGANRIGRLNATTGHLDEFYGHGLSSNAGLSDIKVALDNHVWIGGQTVQRLIELTTDSPSVYTFTEYTDTARPNFMVAPAFLAIDASNRIWTTMPDMALYQIAQFTPSSRDFVWPTLPTGSRPEDIIIAAGYAWCADRSRNKIDQVQYETFPLVNSFGPVKSPMEIAAASPNELWVTEDGKPGAIARFVYTSVVSFQISSVALPMAELRPTGIDTALDNSVWVAAYTPVRIYLPLVLRSL